MTLAYLILVLAEIRLLGVLTINGSNDGWDCLKVDDCLLKTTGSANEILNILLEQWIMFGQ